MIAHVYFFTLPINTKFMYKGQAYKKVSNNQIHNAKSDLTQKVETFGAQYGCVISKKQAQKFKIPANHYRPLDKSFCKVIDHKDTGGGISIKAISDEAVQRLKKPYEKGKWYIIQISNIYHPNSLSIDELPKRLQGITKMALSVASRC